MCTITSVSCALNLSIILHEMEPWGGEDFIEVQVENRPEPNYAAIHTYMSFSILFNPIQFHFTSFSSNKQKMKEILNLHLVNERFSSEKIRSNNNNKVNWTRKESFSLLHLVTFFRPFLPIRLFRSRPTSIRNSCTSMSWIGTRRKPSPLKAAVWTPPSFNQTSLQPTASSTSLTTFWASPTRLCTRNCRLIRCWSK